MTTALTGLLWGLLALGGGPIPHAHGAVSDSIVGPGAAVPFIAQSPLLCGGAAAAMVERHLGGRGVHGDDFSHLVRPDEGGIRTSDLVGALRDRGVSTRVSRDDPAAARAALEAGLAPILLLDGGGPELHYVVLVGMDSTRAWYHDPNRAPNRGIALDDLLERWRDSGFWMATAYRLEGTERGSTAAPDDPRPASVPSGPTPPAPSSAPALDSAMVHLRAGDHAAARAAVEHLRDAAEASPSAPTSAPMSAHGRLAWRITATAHWLEGDTESALHAWNRLGEPGVDLVRIDGLRHTRYHAARRRMDITDGVTVRPGRLRLARRRLEALPSVAESRVSIRPIANGDVEVRAALLEHPRRPGRLRLAATAGTALLRSEARLEAGPLLGAGDRWAVAGAWHPAREFASAEVATPAPPVPGITRLALDWRRETHADAPGGQERLRGEFAVGEWIRPGLRLEASTALESWVDGARRLSLGGAVRWVGVDDRLRVDVDADGWTGDDAGFGRIRGAARVTLPLDERREVRVRVGGAAVSESAPPLLRPGAGAGPFRDILLRAHSVERDGALGGPTLAPRLVHGGAEFRAYRRIGPVRLGGLLFADAVAVPAHDDLPDPRAFIDVGVGAVLEMSGREAQVTLAYGEPGWRLSARLLEVDAR